MKDYYNSLNTNIFPTKDGITLQSEQIYTPRKKKKWIMLGIAALIIIIAGINIAVMQTKKGTSPAIQFSTAAVKELSNIKLIAGQIMPKKIESLYADPAKGNISELYVKEGQAVSKGQKLFSYDNPELAIQLKQLEIDKKSTGMKYDQGKTKIASLQKEIQSAKDANASKSILEPLESQLQDLQFQQQTTELEIEKNKLTEEDLQNKLKDLIVYSGTSGVVQIADKDTVQSSAQTAGTQSGPIVQIASKDPFIIQGTLTELQKSQIQPNQPITITAKAVSNKIWKGKISEISQYPSTDVAGQSAAAVGAQQTQNISYYNYMATLDSQDGLSPGFHVSLQVNLSTKKMLVIPSSCIIEKGNSRYVYILKKTKLHRQNIVTGIGDGSSTEILNGLKAGDKVVKNPSANVYDGLDVKGK